MRLTPRLVLLLALGALPLLFVGLAPWLLDAVLLYNALLAACAIADFLASPRPENALTLERTVDDKLSLGASNPVTLEARNSSTQPIKLTVRDLPPPTFDLDRPAMLTLTLPPDPRPICVTYHVTPPAKGDFAFGDLYVQYPGRLGLIMRQGKIAARREVKVYPNLLETAKYELLARRGRLQQLGIRSTKIRGGGSEFESLRDYVPGDEYKKIDWSATARRGKLISRQYEAERSQNIVLLLDTGRTMLQPVQKMAKLDFVVNTALMLAYVAAASDDKVGLMAFDADIRVYLPPAKSKAQVYGILESLYNLDARMVETDYKAAFQNLATRWRRRSLVVLFSDLVDPELVRPDFRRRPHAGRHAPPGLRHCQRPQYPASRQRRPPGRRGRLPESRRPAGLAGAPRRHLHPQTPRRLDHRQPPEDLSADLINHYLDLKSRSLI